jgi:hypothetical protein
VHVLQEGGMLVSSSKAEILISSFLGVGLEGLLGKICGRRGEGEKRRRVRFEGVRDLGYGIMLLRPGLGIVGGENVVLVTSKRIVPSCSV